MTAVVVSRKLTLAIGEKLSQSYASEFSLWKQGLIGAGDFFGKTTPFVAPPAIKNVLEKVHLEHKGVSRRWDAMLREGVLDPQAYTSDKILVFGRMWDVRLSPYMLVTILEPGHDQMKDWPMLAGVGAYFGAESAAFSREYPTTAWVTSGFPSN
jgi:mRNA interferase YafO